MSAATWLLTAHHKPKRKNTKDGKKQNKEKKILEGARRDRTRSCRGEIVGAYISSGESDFTCCLRVLSSSLSHPRRQAPATPRRDLGACLATHSPMPVLDCSPQSGCFISKPVGKHTALPGLFYQRTAMVCVALCSVLIKTVEGNIFSLWSGGFNSRC